MSAMQQIYATHCTFGTSAIERREGEMAERVLGYSARSSSFTPADLRKHFRTFERYLSYNLWSDAPAELRTTLVAATAPKRMVFMPSMSGFQMLGHIAYRTWDTTGKRAGSYFAHLVVAERGKDEAPWSILDCLRLWNAPGWLVEDSPAFSYDLPLLNGLSGLWVAPPERAYEDPFEPVIGDEFLRRFLTEDDLSAGPGANFLPSRWLVMPAARRLELFRQALRGYLHIAGQGRDNAVIVAEPEVAALFFYGIARLLPDGELRQAISFSTFEGNLDRPATQLIGTHFHDPFKTDLRPDRYQRGFALNTYLDGKATELRNPHPYAEMILGRLIADGWQAVDEVFAAFHAGLGKTVADLGELVRAGELAERFLDPAANLDVASLERNDFARRYVSKSISTTLAGSASETVLRPLIDTPDQRAIALLKLLVSGPHAAACEGSLRYLREQLPESQLPRFLELSEFPLELKTRTLARFVDQERRLPAGLEDLFDVALNATRSVPRNARDQQLAPLAAPLLRELRSDTVRVLADNMPAASQPAFFVELAEAVGPADDKQKWLRRLAVKGGNMSDESLSLAIERLGDRLDRLMPDTRREIGYRFIQVLNAIQRVPAEFETRLNQLRRVKRLIETMDDLKRDESDLGPSWLPIDRLNAWERVPEAIKQARMKSQEKKSGWAALRGEGPNDAQFRIGRQMAEALSHALPHNELRSEISSQDKAVMMHNIIVALGAADLLAPDWKTRAAHFLEYNHWYDTAAPVNRTSESARRPWMFFAIGVTAATVLGTVLLFAFFGGGSRKSAPAGGNQQVAQGGKAAGAAAKANNKNNTKGKPNASTQDNGKPKTTTSTATPTPPALPTPPVTPTETNNTPVPSENANTNSPGDSAKAESSGTSEAKPDRKDSPPAAKTSGSAPSPPAVPPIVPLVPPTDKGAPQNPMMKPAKAGPGTTTAATINLETTPGNDAKPMEPPASREVPPPPKPQSSIERDFEIAEIPRAAPDAIRDLLSDSYRPLGEGNATPDISWVLWEDDAAKGFEFKFRIHGLQLAVSPWIGVNGVNVASVVPVSTPDKYVVRATLKDGMEVDLMEFRKPVSKGSLTMKVPGLVPSSKELGNIQRQLFFCVLEIKSDTAESRYLSLYPPRTNNRVSMDIEMKSNADTYGIIMGKSDSSGIAPRPEEQRLQKLSIAGGALKMKDGRVYYFGESKGIWSGRETNEWPLVPRQTEPPVPPTECHIRFSYTTGSDAKLLIDIPKLPEEDTLEAQISSLGKAKSHITEKRVKIHSLYNGRNQLAPSEGIKLDPHVVELTDLCDVTAFLFPKESEHPDPDRGKRREGKSPYEVAIDGYYDKLAELVGKLDKTVKSSKIQSTCEIKLKKIDDERRMLTDKLQALRKPRLETLETFKKEASYSRVEIYRVVARESDDRNVLPRLIRIPTVVNPPSIAQKADVGT